MRVLVVRPRAAADRTARRLAALGHEPVLAPIFATVPTDDPPPAGAFDALVLTSASAVPGLARLDGRFASLPVFAVGDRTAEAARAAGFLRTVSAGGDAAALADRVGRDMPAGAALLHAAGRDRKPEPAGLLEAAGFRLAVWDAYESRALAVLPEPARSGLADGSVGAILHYSRRGAAHLRALTRAPGLDGRFAAVAHACLSADVAAALDGIARVAVARRPDESALLALLDP